MIEQDIIDRVASLGACERGMTFLLEQPSVAMALRKAEVCHIHWLADMIDHDERVAKLDAAAAAREAELDEPRRVYADVLSTVDTSRVVEDQRVCLLCRLHRVTIQ